jgi:hypothetical protein
MVSFTLQGGRTRRLAACLSTHRLRGLCRSTGGAQCYATGTRRRSGVSMTTLARTTTCPPSWSAPCATIPHAPMRAAPPAGTASAGSAWTSGSHSRSATASAAHAPTADVSAGLPSSSGPAAWLGEVLHQQTGAAWASSCMLWLQLVACQDPSTTLQHPAGSAAVGCCVPAGRPSQRHACTCHMACVHLPDLRATTS